jgi:hypothetical protein
MNLPLKRWSVSSSLRENNNTYFKKKENMAYRSQIWIIKKTRVKNMLNNGDCP